MDIVLPAADTWTLSLTDVTGRGCRPLKFVSAGDRNKLAEDDKSGCTAKWMKASILRTMNVVPKIQLVWTCS